MEILLTVKEVASLLKVHPNHIRRLMGSRAIPHFKKPGVGVRFDPKEIKKWMEEGHVGVEDWDKKAQEILDR